MHNPQAQYLPVFLEVQGNPLGTSGAQLSCSPLFTIGVCWGVHLGEGGAWGVGVGSGTT